MDIPSDTPSVPPSPQPLRLRTILIGGVSAAIVLAVAAGVLWLLFAACRIIVTFVVTYHVTIIALIVIALLLWGVGAAVNAQAKREAQIRARRLREIAQLHRVDAMTGPEFEHLVADLLRRDGYLDVLVVGRGGDKGVDVVAHTSDKRKIAIQCKRQSSTVTADRVRNLVGAIHCAYTGHHGVLVTSSTFTRPALDEGQGRILMVGRDQLAEWMNGEVLRL